MSSAFGSAGELFVRIRPNDAGFAAEATPGIQSAGTSLGKVFVAAFSVVAIGDVIKHTVQAAVQQQATFATLNRVVSNAGAANVVHGDTIDNLVKQQAALKGFSVADTAAAFQKIVSVTRDSSLAFKDLGIAQDLARGTGKDLTISALAVDKALQGNYTSLTRYGIIVHPVIAAVTALKEAHTAAADAGAKFTAEENLAYAAAIKQATIQDKLATGQAALAAIEQRFGGTAGVYARTAAGEYDRLRVSVHELEVTIGQALLPALTTGVTDLAHWVDSLTKSKSVTDAAKTAGHDLGVVLHDIGAAAKTVGPPLLEVAKVTLQVAQAIGAPALLTAAATFEGIKVATALAKDAQAAYNAVLIAGGATRVAEVSETAALTTAIEANTLALRGQMVAANEAQLAIDGLGAAEATVATETEALAGALTGGSFLAGLGALASGPAAIAIGVTALAGGIAYLASREDQWTAANQGATSSLQALTAATNAQKTAVGALAKAAAEADAVKARGQAAAAITALAAASTAQLQSQTRPALSAAGVNTAANQLIRLRDAGLGAEASTDKFNLALGNQLLAIGKSNPLLTHNVTLVGQLAQALGDPRLITPAEITLLINNQEPAAGLGEILSGLSEVETVIQNLGKTLAGPPPNPAIYKTTFGGGIKEAAQDAAAAALADAQAGKAHDLLTAAAKAQILSLQQGIDLSQSQLANLNQSLADAVQQGAIAVFNAVQQGKQNLNTIGQDIATSIGTYLDTPLTLAANALQLHADRITASYASLNAGLDIQTNQLQTHADRIAAAFAGPNAALDRETAQIGLRADQLALKNLGRSVLLPGVGALSSVPQTAIRELNAYLQKIPEASRGPLQQFIDQYELAFIKVKKDHISLAEAVTPKAATEAAGIRVSKDQIAGAELITPLNAAKAAAIKVNQDIATNTKIETARALADITDLFNRKKIQWGTLSADVVQILKHDKVNFGEAGRVDGVAFVDRFVGEIAGLRQQALANAAGPQQGGAGLLPNIIHPLTILENTQKQIAGISHQIAAAHLSELKSQTKILALIHGYQKGGATITSLSKNPGGATHRHSRLAGVNG